VAEWETQRTQTKLDCSPGNQRCRTAQSWGNLSNGDPEPSPIPSLCCCGGKMSNSSLTSPGKKNFVRAAVLINAKMGESWDYRN